MMGSDRLARWLSFAAGLIVAAVVAYALVRPFARPPADPRTGTSGLAVETDQQTGCQYVVTPWGGIFVRLDADGKPLCRGSSAKPD